MKVYNMKALISLLFGVAVFSVQSCTSYKPKVETRETSLKQDTNKLGKELNQHYNAIKQEVEYSSIKQATSGV